MNPDVSTLNDRTASPTFRGRVAKVTSTHPHSTR
jgi:hypothetical protein